MTEQEKLSINCAGKLGFSLNHFSSIGVFPTTPSKNGKFFGRNATIHDICTSPFINDGNISSSLAVLSHEIFAQFFSEDRSTESCVGQQYSRKYREVIKAVCHDILESIETVTDETLENNSEIEAMNYFLLSEMEVLSSLEQLWYLVEIIFLKVPENGDLTRELQIWFTKNCTFGTEFVNNLLSHRPQHQFLLNDSAEANFWPAVLLLTLQGRIQDVTLLLSKHRNGTSYSMKKMHDLLSKMPQSCDHDDYAWMHEFMFWKEEVYQAMNDGDFSPVKELQLIAKIICMQHLQKDGVFVYTEVTRYLEDLFPLGSVPWYYLFISHCFYTRPNLTWNGFDWAAQSFKELLQYTPESPIEKLMDLVFDLNIMGFIRECGSLLNNNYFLVHIIPLIAEVHPQVLHLDPQYSRVRTLSDTLNIEKINQSVEKRFNGSSLQLNARRDDEDDDGGDDDNDYKQAHASLLEMFIIRYVESLLSEKDLYTIALDYLNYCPLYGKDIQNSIVERWPIETQREAVLVVTWCERNGRYDALRTVCRCLCRQELHRQNYGQALYWARRSECGYLLTASAQVCLDHCMEAGDLKRAYTLLSFLSVASTTESQTSDLSFFSNLCNLLKCLFQEADSPAEDREEPISSNEIVKSFLDLVTDPRTPKKFRVPLLLQSRSIRLRWKLNDHLLGLIRDSLYENKTLYLKGEDYSRELAELTLEFCR